MIVNTTSIKNLAIALEALSHTRLTTHLYTRIEYLLEAELTRAEERIAEQDQAPKRIDDDIPF